MRKLLLSFSFLLICFLANAGKNVKGYYINNKGDTVNCTFSISTELLSSNSNYIEEQFKIKIILSENKTIILIPDTVKALVFMDGKKMKFVTLENNFGLPEGVFSAHKPFVFIEQILDGFIKLYVGRYWATSSGPNGAVSSYPSANTYIKKGDSAIVEMKYKNWRFRNQISEILFDNPELVYKVINKEYNEDDYLIVFSEYNNWKKNGSIIPNDTTIHNIVDVKPKFEGNDFDDLNYYFKPKIKWPKDVSKSSRIAFQGVVEKDGSLSNIQMAGFKDKPELNVQFLDIAKTMSKWSPARYKGLVVRSIVTFIIKY